MERYHNIVRHAYHTVPFYQELFDECSELDDIDLTRLPVVDKRQMVTSGRMMLSSKYIPQYMAKTLKWYRTSGSTGISYEVYWDENDEKNSLKGLWLLRWKYYGITPKHRLVYFFPSIGGCDKYRKRENSLAVSRGLLCQEDLMEVFTLIKEYKPQWMILQPSVAVLLCDLVKQYGALDDIQYIEFTGEYLDSTVRKMVEETFHCKTANQYGTKEVNSIAYECPKGHMHIMSDNVYLEQVGENLCVTSLCNHAMPFVRYCLEDRGKIIQNVRCECGRCGDVLQLYSGRSNDFIKRADGRIYHAYKLMQIVQTLNYEMGGSILQYQIIQQDFDDFLFRIVLENDITVNEQDWLTRRLQEDTRGVLGDKCNVVVLLEEKLFAENDVIKSKVFLSNI